jgi:D-alanyl-D-alanine carboxypeptidase
MKKKIIALFFCFSILFVAVSYSKINTANAQTGSAEIVMEVNSNRVLKGNNIHNKMYMASLTKIVTAIVIIENCDLNDIATVSKETVGIEGSSIYLEEG